MTILIIGCSRKGLNFINQIISKIYDEAGINHPSLSDQFQQFNQQYKLLSSNDIANYDSFVESSEGFFWAPTLNSRIHIHDFDQFVVHHAHLLLDYIPLAPAEYPFDRFDRIIYVDEFDPRIQLVKKASLNGEIQKEYIHHHYVESILEWIKTKFIPLADSFQHHKTAYFFLSDFSNDPKNSIEKLSKCLGVSPHKRNIENIVDWMTTQQADVDKSKPWETFFTKTQRFTVQFVFGPVFHLFDNKRKIKSSHTIKISSLLSTIHHHLKLYDFITRQGIIHALLSRQ